MVWGTGAGGGRWLVGLWWCQGERGTSTSLMVSKKCENKTYPTKYTNFSRRNEEVAYRPRLQLNHQVEKP